MNDTDTDLMQYKDTGQMQGTDTVQMQGTDIVQMQGAPIGVKLLKMELNLHDSKFN